MSMAALAFAGGAIGAMGAMEQGKADVAAAKYNAAMARREAEFVRQQAAEEERQVRIMGRKALGEISAGYAANGLTMEGSAYDVMAESAANVKMDALNVRYQGEMQSLQLESEARMAEWQGKVAKRMSYFSAASSLLGGGAGAARYSGLTRSGGNPSSYVPSTDGATMSYSSTAGKTGVA